MSKKQFIPLVIFHIIFWIFSSYFIIDFFSLESEEINITVDGTEMIERNHNPFMQRALLIGILVRILFFYGHAAYLSAYLFVKRYRLYFIGTFTLILGTMILEGIIAYFIGNIPWVSLWRILIPIYVFYYFASLIFSFFKRWQHEEHKRTQLKNQLIKAELKALRSQFDPHFIFNTLNSLLFIAEKEGNYKISAAIEEMSALMRSIIYDFKSPTIPLMTELDLVRKYVNLQLLKYDEKDDINTSLNSDPAIEHLNAEIAPLILLPFVENAMKHGISIYEKSYVEIECKMNGENFIFIVRNTNHSSQNDQGGIGLENVRKRLNYLYPDKHSVGIEEGSLYRVSLEINLNHQPSTIL